MVWLDMFTLSTFYQSDEWKRFRENVIAERLTEDGLTIDEVTGKPIFKRFDIILHHKEHLTEENVNDYNISLNPDNVQIVSHRTHNLIHGNNYSGRREVYLVYGAPLSGKSTYLDSVRQSGDLIVDVDRIRQCVSGEATHIIHPKLNALVFEIRNMLLDAVRVRKGKWIRAYIIGGYPLATERKRLCAETGAVEVFVEASKEECFERLEAEPDNRDKDLWRKYIEEWFERYSAG